MSLTLAHDKIRTIKYKYELVKDNSAVRHGGGSLYISLLGDATQDDIKGVIEQEIKSRTPEFDFDELEFNINIIDDKNHKVHCVPIIKNEHKTYWRTTFVTGISLGVAFITGLFIGRSLLSDE